MRIVDATPRGCCSLLSPLGRKMKGNNTNLYIPASRTGYVEGRTSLAAYAKEDHDLATSTLP